VIRRLCRLSIPGPSETSDRRAIPLPGGGMAQFSCAELGGGKKQRIICGNRGPATELPDHQGTITSGPATELPDHQGFRVADAAFGVRRDPPPLQALDSPTIRNERSPGNSVARWGYGAIQLRGARRQKEAAHYMRKPRSGNGIAGPSAITSGPATELPDHQGFRVA